jgi:hypothetical protein
MPAVVMAPYAYPLRGKSSKGSEERRDRPVRLSAAPRSWRYVETGADHVSEGG